ncbi:MAG: hypothetical protein APR53_04440 [Methanoculleus sp. SDB]|nr:MAG: hypothetical protein APR53_04440 [Methanoculleus sp. SDB]
MGFAEDAIFSYIERALRRVYPLRDGWEIKRRPANNNRVPDYFIQKKRFGRTHRILVEVAIAPAVTDAHIDHLNAYADKMEKLLLPCEKKTVVVPTGTDISKVPGDTDVLFLDVLKIEGEEIVWVKKFIHPRLPDTDD